MELHNACRDREPEAVILKLLEKDEEYNDDNNWGGKALYYACCYKMESVALKLIEKDINHNYRTHDTPSDDTPLRFACIYKMDEVALKLLANNVDVNNITWWGTSALVLACENNMEAVALKILERGELDYNNKDDCGRTAFYYACKNHMESVVLKLLEKEDLIRCVLGTTWLEKIIEKSKQNSNITQNEEGEEDELLW
jgi:hypothetical protein